MSRVLLLILACSLVFAEDKKENRPRRQAEISLRIIEASSVPTAKNDAVTLVPAELKSLLRYSRYGLLDNAYLRGEEREGHRIAVAGNLRGRLRYTVEPNAPLRIEFEIDGPPDDKGKSTRLLETSTTAKSGETVVLGASRMRGGDNGLIVLVNIKLLP